MDNRIENIKNLFQEGKSIKATHLIIIKYNNKFYPVFVFPEEDVFEIELEYRVPKNKIWEVYNLKQSFQQQFKSNIRIFNY